MTKIPKIPTADEEALQQPTIDPIFLLTSMLSGGISGFQNASAEQKALDTLRQQAAPELSKLMTEDIPLLKTTLMDALGGGANFAGGAALNHQIMPNHPLLSNALALPLVPAIETAASKGDVVENWLLKNHPGIQDLWGRLKPLISAPLLLRDQKNGR